MSLVKIMLMKTLNDHKVKKKTILLFFQIIETVVSKNKH